MWSQDAYDADGWMTFALVSGMIVGCGVGIDKPRGPRKGYSLDCVQRRAAGAGVPSWNANIRFLKISMN